MNKDDDDVVGCNKSFGKLHNRGLTENRFIFLLRGYEAEFCVKVGFGTTRNISRLQFISFRTGGGGVLLCNIKTIFTTSIVNVTLGTTLTALVQVDVLHVVGVVGGNVLVDVGVVGN